MVIAGNDGVLESIEKAREQLGSVEPQERVCGAVSLAHLPQHVVIAKGLTDDVVSLLTDHAPEVRSAACAMLAMMGAAAMPHAERVSALLDDENVSVRLEAVRSLGLLAAGRSNNEVFADGIARVLNSADEPFLQLYVLQALGALGTSSKADDVAVFLLSPLPEIRVAAAAALGGMKAKPMDVSVLLTTGETPEERTAALAALAAMKENAGPAATAIAEKLGDPSLRRAAIDALAGLGEAAAPFVPQIVDLLENYNIHTRFKAFNALVALKKYAQADTVAKLAKLLSNKDASLKAIGAFALGELGEEQAGPHVEAIVKLLADKKGELRTDDIPVSMRKPCCAAALAIAKLGAKGHAHAAAIAKHCKSKDFQMQLSAIEALGEMGAAGAAHAKDVAAVLEDQVPLIGIKAMLALGRMAKFGLDDAIVQKIVAKCHGSVREVKLTAAQVLGQIGSPIAISTLAGLLKSDNLELVHAALQALAVTGELAAEHADAVGVFFEDQIPAMRYQSVATAGAMKATALTDKVAGLLVDDDVEIACAACAALGQMGDAGAAVLAGQLQLDSAKIRGAAAAALGHTGVAGMKSAPAITELLDSPIPLVRQNAAIGLGKLAEGGHKLPKDAIRKLNDATQDDYVIVREAADEAVKHA